MTTRKLSKATLALLCLCILFLGPHAAFAQSRGCQFIGASRTSAKDIMELSNILVDSGGHIQVSMLPFEFNPNNPFFNVSALVQMVTPKLNGTLTVTFYLKWFPHDGPGNADQSEFWNAWEASRPTKTQQRIRNNFLSRVQRTNEWVAGARLWAVQAGVAGKFGVTVVPVLEDTCQSRTAYRNLLTAIRQQQAFDGTPTTLRRSCLSSSKYAFSLDIPLELHGTWDSVSGRLGRGDAWSNDGTDYDTEDFKRDQKKALNRGVHVMFWRLAYNGEPKKRDNWTERTVDPFSRTSPAERRALREVLGN